MPNFLKISVYVLVKQSIYDPISDSEDIRSTKSKKEIEKKNKEQLQVSGSSLR